MEQHIHYGYRRVALELGISKNRVQRIMHLYDLHPKSSPHQKNYKQHKGLRLAPRNIIKEDNVIAKKPNHIWAQDFTYLWCLGRWYYVATVIDVYSREIIGFSISIHHDSKLTLEALYDALSKQIPPIYLHFDRGSEYLSSKHLDLLDSLEIRASASALGSPWQNGFQERFYGSFKTELGSLKNIASEGELFELVALSTKLLQYQTNPYQT